MSLIYHCTEYNTSTETCVAGQWQENSMADLFALSFGEANQLASAMILLLALAYVFRKLIQLVKN